MSLRLFFIGEGLALMGAMERVRSSRHANVGVFSTAAGLGLTPGTYTYTFGSGVTADSFILNIGLASTVPEPASTALLALGLGALFFFARRKHHHDQTNLS